MGSAAVINGPGDYLFEVKESAHFQHNYITIFGAPTFDGIELKTYATLYFEEGNPFDRNAVAVMIDSLVLGYVDKKNSKNIREQIAKSEFAGRKVFVVGALVAGGWNRGGEGKKEIHAFSGFPTFDVIYMQVLLMSISWAQQ